MMQEKNQLLQKKHRQKSFFFRATLQGINQPIEIMDNVKYTLTCCNTLSALNVYIQRLKIWNLFTGLHEDPQNSAQDHIHALAQEGRSLLKKAIFLSLKGTVCFLSGDDNSGTKLHQKAARLEKRELILLAECRSLINDQTSKEAE